MPLPARRSMRAREKTHEVWRRAPPELKALAWEAHLEVVAVDNGIAKGFTEMREGVEPEEMAAWSNRRDAERQRAHRTRVASSAAD
jgi:hypothetical protein